MERNDLNLNRLHEKQYQILVEFDRVCRKYDLKYFLGFGTLLGAVRHSGFIPWDDDIDTMMPYEDYIKLKNIPSVEWRKPFFFQSPESDKNYTKCFSKVRNSETTLITEDNCESDINQGVDIDIYPIINLADDPVLRKKQYRNTMAYMLFQVNTPPRNHGKLFYFVGKVALTLTPDLLKSKLKAILLKKLTAYQGDSTKNCYVVCGNIEIMRQVLETEWFEKSILHNFEQQEFPIPIGYDEWLISRYGRNYMDMPPKEMQGIKLEQFIKVDLDNPYVIYKGEYYCCQNQKRKKASNKRWHNYSD